MYNHVLDSLGTFRNLWRHNYCPQASVQLHNVIVLCMLSLSLSPSPSLSLSLSLSLSRSLSHAWLPPCILRPGIHEVIMSNFQYYVVQAQ